MNDGTALRDAGIAAALEHSESENVGWAGVAMACLHRYARTHREFTSEQCTAAADTFGLVTAQPKAWGAIYAKAARLGIISPGGIGRSLKRHHSVCILWKSNVYRGNA